MIIKTLFWKRGNTHQWYLTADGEGIGRGLSFSRDDAGEAAKIAKLRWSMERLKKGGAR